MLVLAIRDLKKYPSRVIAYPSLTKSVKIYGLAVFIWSDYTQGIVSLFILKMEKGQFPKALAIEFHEIVAKCSF